MNEGDAAYNNFLNFNAMYGVEPGDFDGHDTVMACLDEDTPRSRSRSRTRNTTTTSNKDKQGNGTDTGTKEGKSSKDTSSNETRKSHGSSVEESGLRINDAQQSYLYRNGFFGSLHHFASSYGISLENHEGQKRAKSILKDRMAEEPEEPEEPKSKRGGLSEDRETEGDFGWTW